MRISINYIWLAMTMLAMIVFVKVCIERCNEIVGVFNASSIEYRVADGEVVHSSYRKGYKYIDRYHIAYQYLVDGSLYRSEVIDYLGDYANVEKYLKRYPVGSKVKVYYDKRDPSFSVLEPTSISYLIFILPSMLLFFVLFSLFMSFFSVRRHVR